MIKAVIFDFAGVLGADGYWMWLSKVVPDLENRRKFFKNLADSVDKGTISNQEFVTSLSQATGVLAEKIWPDVKKYFVINTQLLVVIEKLKHNYKQSLKFSLRSNYKIGLLTNFTDVWIKELIAENNLKKYFDAIFISSVEKLMKPEPKAYQRMLEMLQVTPEEAIFFDDRQTNIDAAKNLGINAFVFTGNKQVIQNLNSLGIDV